MRLNVFALYNKKVGSYNSPTFSNLSVEDTQTSLTRFCILNKEDAIKQHFNECELYHLGEFDDQLGEFLLSDKPVFVCELTTLFKE